MPSRRNFLQDTAAAGILITQVAAAAEGDAKPKAAGKNYRAAVIGSTGHGNYGHGLDSVWKHLENVQLVGVADDNPAGLAAATKRLGTDQGFADYREMLDKLKPDVVSIAPRWVDRHRDMVLDAASRGIHIYLEKPLCRTLSEADEMVAACEKNKVKLAIAHQTRYSPLIGVVKELIASGKIGKLVELRGRGKEDRRGGGEDLWVLGSHIMNLIRTFGGEPAWCFARVEQSGQPVTKSDVIEGNEGFGPLTGDSVSAMYGLPDGVNAYFSSKRERAGKSSRFAVQIFGSQGVIEVTSGFHPTVSILEDSGWSPARTGTAWKKVSSNGIDKPETLTDQGLEAGNVAAVKDLFAAIEADRQPLCSVYDARGAIEMIVATFDSQRMRGPVAMPLKTRVNPLTLLG